MAKFRRRRMSTIEPHSASIIASGRSRCSLSLSTIAYASSSRASSSSACEYSASTHGLSRARPFHRLVELDHLRGVAHQHQVLEEARW